MYKDALHHDMTGEISIVYFILEYIFYLFSYGILGEYLKKLMQILI